MKIKVVFLTLLFGTIIPIHAISGNQSYGTTQYNPEINTSFLLAVAAKKDDIRQAERFLESLPVGCSNSYITTRGDGTVIIHIRCSSTSDSMDGEIAIKNGIVKQIR